METLYPAYRGGAIGLIVLLAIALQGCSFAGSGPPEAHFTQFDAAPPSGNTVTVCSAYGCKHQSSFTFSRRDIGSIAAVMQSVMRQSSPAEERRGIAYALAWIEKRVGPETGTAGDRAALDYAGSGDPGQQDCVDEATNATSYMVLMERHGLLRYHRVLAPMSWA